MNFLPIQINEAQLEGLSITDGQLIFVKDKPAIYLDAGETRYSILLKATESTAGIVQPDNDTIKINDGVISADVIGNWSTGVSYPVGYFAVYDNVLYQCVKANSDTEWTESNWTLIGSASGTGMTINNWTANTDYTVGNLVINATTIYQCNTEHTSGDTFDTTYWTAMTGEKGDDGVSPTAKIEQTDTGAIITVTDASGETTATLTNGVSPTATTTQTDTGCTLSVTDGNGTTISVLSNGKDGTDGITPHIDETTKNWFVGETDTGIVAEGKDGISPTATIAQTDTGCTLTVTSAEQTTVAELKNGVTPEIDDSTKHWFIDGVDTGVTAEGSVEINADCAVLYATFLADGWSDTAPYTQTVTVNNVTADNVPIVDISYSDDTTLWEAERTAYNCLTKMETVDGGVIAYCLDNKPESDFTVKMRIAGDMSGLTFVNQDDFGEFIKNYTYEGTLLATSWIGDSIPYSQTIEINGLTENLSPIVDLVVSDDVTTGAQEISEWWKISRVKTSDNSLTVECYEDKPSVDLTFQIRVV